ncbi:MAG: NTP transferase domain-containing protein [Bacteroidales bacterium]|nr:NTP transferase domain-containing protein [Bacteroidales bacterium]
MKFAIISAGEGSRLTQEGVAAPKPLVKVGGVPLIERLIRIFARQGASEIVVIVNDIYPQTKRHLDVLRDELSVPLRIVVKTTPSSMHSFWELSSFLSEDKFCLTTVDTIFHEEEFTQYIKAFLSSDVDGMMAVTDYVDDEKPLYVSTDNQLAITGFHDTPDSACRYVSGGIYCLTPPCLRTLRHCMEEGMSRMRNFQRQLVADGLRLRAYPFSKILDVDHASDIAKANEFLSMHPTDGKRGKRVLGVARGSEYSPNHETNDAAIINLVAEHVRKQGFDVTVCNEKEIATQPIPTDFVFSMARGESALKRLRELEQTGIRIVNSPMGIANCAREAMTRKLLAAGVPHPETVIVSTHERYSGAILPCWVKRGNAHAMVKEDVVYAESVGHVNRVLSDFHSRGIPTAVINKHLEGDLVKFYGVRDTDFFYWFYPDVRQHSKFGLEIVNGEAKGYRFSRQALVNAANLASKELDVPIYGGDCIVAPDGSFSIIDFNDWPSFARCREEAAPYIAKLIMNYEF